MSVMHRVCACFVTARKNIQWEQEEAGHAGMAASGQPNANVTAHCSVMQSIAAQ